MTFIEFAENVLGVKLLDWQKVVLEKAQECKDEGKSFYIHTDGRAGKTLLNNVIQQKLGYDRAVDELKSLLRCRNHPGCAAGKGCGGICSIDSDICKSCENFGIPYSLLAEQLEGGNK